jgi:hypothetical protein
VVKISFEENGFLAIKEKKWIKTIKARFVAMGFTQREFSETFAGVMVSKSFRIMLVILNEEKTNEFEHWDVRMAFTQAPLEETLFMYQPEFRERAYTKKFRPVASALF